MLANTEAWPDPSVRVFHAEYRRNVQADWAACLCRAHVQKVPAPHRTLPVMRGLLPRDNQGEKARQSG
jgi:hypothetical protein